MATQLTQAQKLYYAKRRRLIAQLQRTRGKLAALHALWHRGTAADSDVLDTVTECVHLENQLAALDGPEAA